jgi:hypothetical protein
MAAPLVGGQPFYGFSLGIILMENHCARPVGDVGHAATFDFPVLYDVADGAGVRDVVEQGGPELLDCFIDSAKRLEARGVRAIATSCGFTALYQQELADAVSVPVATSSLLQIPLALRLLPAGARIGVVTANAATLRAEHLGAAGVSEAEQRRLTVVGLERTEAFYPSIVGGRLELDVDAVRSEVVAACRSALDRDPDIRSWVFECTNLPPYRAAVRAATGLPVHDAVTLFTWLHGSTQP